MVGSGRSLIIVEDEPLIAMMIEGVVRDLGWLVAGLAVDEREALALMERSPDLAILDYRLGSGTSLAIASACRDRGIGIVFVTGYQGEEIAGVCGDAPIVAKPFTPCELAAAVELALPGGATGNALAHDTVA
jgi:CheY-like chemotaxis protein